jgi:sortase A
MQHESRRARKAAAAAARRKVSVVGVLGELLLTAGAVVLLFLGWQVWFNDAVLGNQQQNEAAELSQSWDKGEGQAPARVDRPDPGEPAVMAAPANTVKFGNLYVPRFGADYMRPIAEGVGIEDVLNRHGIGHYPGTQMPGEIGNMALAAHRTGWGSSFIDVDKLQVGDSIWVETEAGWYRYEFRSLEYVSPSGVGVLDPVPQFSGAAPADRIITLTSCNPLHSIAERIIAYGVLDTWYPRAGGPPEEIAALVQGAA